MGSLFLDERSDVIGIGPLCVAPESQGNGIGRFLMQMAMARSTARKHNCMRLMQASFNTGSFSLYAKLGFGVQESMAPTRWVRPLPIFKPCRRPRQP